MRNRYVLKNINEQVQLAVEPIYKGDLGLSDDLFDYIWDPIFLGRLPISRSLASSSVSNYVETEIREIT